MGAGINELGVVQKTPTPNRQRPKPPDNYWSAENERQGGGHTFNAAYGRVGNTCVRTTVIPFREYPQAVRSILGYTAVSGDPGQLTRYLPWRDPVNHGMYAQSVTVRGVSPDGFAEWVPNSDPNSNPGDAGYTPRWPLRTHSLFVWAELTITFGTIAHDLAERLDDQVFSVNQLTGEVQGKDPGDGELVNAADGQRFGLTGFAEQRRYCVKQVREAREYVTALPGNFVRGLGANEDPPPVNDARTTVQFPIPEVLSYADVTVTWLDVPLEAVPYEAIGRAQGKVNDQTFELPNRPPPDLYGAETLLLQSFAFDNVYFPDTDSTRAFNITYHFRWRGSHKGLGILDPSLANWNKVPIPLVKDNNNAEARFTRVYRKPVRGAYPKNAVGKPLGIFDVFRFDYLFRPRRPILPF